MTFWVRIDPMAQRQMDEFAVWLRAYSEDFAVEHIDRLGRILLALPEQKQGPSQPRALIRPSGTFSHSRRRKWEKAISLMAFSRGSWAMGEGARQGG